MPLISRRLTADLALLATVVAWGITFVAIKTALPDIGVFSFLTIRFCLAFVFLAILFRSRLAHIGWPAWKAGAILGIWLFIGYGFQTVGLIYTTASNAGFITGLSVVLVPCLTAAVTRHLPGRATLTGATLAVCGLALLTLGTGFTINYGDILCFLGAIAYALQIFLLGYYAPRFDAALLTMLQIGIIGGLSAIPAAGFETWPTQFTNEIWLAIAITAIPATSLAFLVQTWAQQFTTPSRTALIFSLEPVFAALTGCYFLGENLNLQQLFGCVLMLGGTLASEFLPETDGDTVPKTS